MTFDLANKLLEKLKNACPVDTGQLKGSIQMLQLGEQEWIIMIGNADGSVNGTPSNQYAAFTNNARTISFKGKTYANPNYHWANTAIEEWAKENIVQMQFEIEEDEE